MLAKHDIWFCDPHVLVKNMLANPNYKGQVDYAPVQEFDDGGSHQYQNLCPETGLGSRQHISIFFCKSFLHY